MTKAELRSLIKNYLRKIDNANKYHDNVIDHSIEHAINQIYGDLFRNNPSDLDDYTYTVGDTGSPIAITLDANTSIYYSTLPNAIVPIGDKASGVRHVYPEEEAEVFFYPMTKKEANLAHNTYIAAAGTNLGKVGYIVRRNRVEYYGLDATAHATIISNGVRMDLLIPFTEFADGDTVILPFGQDIKIQEMAMVFLQQIQEPNLKDDN